MIKNIIFDMGGVLLYFDSKYFVSKATSDPEKQKFLHENIFCKGEWAKLDDGTLTEQEAYESIISRIPEELHDVTKEIVFEWDKWSYQIEGSEKLIRTLKSNGYNLYLLSNAGSRLNEYVDKIVLGYELFNDAIVSADVKLVKPNVEIYRLATKKFNIKPEETLFIDDMAVNVEGAKKALIDAIQFKDTKTLIDDLRKKGVKV